MKLEKELREWYFDDQLPVLAQTGTEDLIESRLYGMCASSTTGKLIIYGGIIDQDNQIPSKKIKVCIFSKSPPFFVYCTYRQENVEISQTLVAFSEYTNFNYFCIQNIYDFFQVEILQTLVL